MNKAFAAAALLAALSAGCGTVTTPSSSPTTQVVGLDDRTRLLVQMEGADTAQGATGYRSLGTSGMTGGAPIHRVLADASGNVLFAYDLAVSKTSGAGYNFTLKPVANAPTFGSSREVTVMPRDTVRVELMEQPETGRKIVDVFKLKFEPSAEERHAPSFLNHLKAVHDRLYHWVHGE